MCITAVIAGASLLMSAVNAVSSISGANSKNKYDQWSAKQQVKQLKVETELQKIASMERESERQRDFNKTWSSSLAAIGAAGMAEHISFFSGISPENQNLLDQDIRAIRLGMVHQESQAFKQIGVIGYGAQVGAYNTKMSNIGSVAEFAQDAMSAYSFYDSYKGAPKAPSGSGSG